MPGGAEPGATVDRDTIAAVATPPGRGGISVIRLSGPASLALADFVARTPAGGALGTLLPGQARFCSLVDPATGAKLDEAVLTYFQAPRSYTGEDVVEISAHGSPVLLDHLLRLLLLAGARLAEPGEFTERAFLAGRIDLTQAEAVRDLIDAQTLLQAQVAAQQLGGALARSVQPHKAELLALIAALEAGIDFAEDDTPVLASAALVARLEAVSLALAVLAGSFTRGRIVSQGVTLAIVGRPNAGKSSLFNRLLDRERAIVTAEPGTTRDTVQERLSIGGIPVELIDTAGLRIAGSEAERLGIEKSREAFADAGLVLLVLDSAGAIDAEEEVLLAAARERRLLVVLNKSDLLEATDTSQVERARALEFRVRELAPAARVLRISALTGDGIEALRAAMETLLGGEYGAVPEPAILTNLRQHRAVTGAQAAIEAALAAAGEELPHELLLLDLYTALHEMDTLTGATTSEDVLGLIFSTFCIGK